jgi:hypothetical protein
MEGVPVLWTSSTGSSSSGVKIGSAWQKRAIGFEMGQTSCLDGENIARVLTVIRTVGGLNDILQPGGV